MSNRFGILFSVTTWGESHGPSMGVVIDGCPAGLPLGVDIIQCALNRRRPGQSSLTSPRKEPDQVRILSGVHAGKTLGTPIALEIANVDARPEDYIPLQDVYRPSHADFTYDQKFGHRDPRGGGRASARETVARVAAGAVAGRLLSEVYGVSCLSWVESVGPLRMPALAPESLTDAAIEAHPVRCPHSSSAAAMAELIAQTQAQGDSLGGVIASCVQGLPVGWGAPVFDRLEADLAKALLSLPATKGFEIGSGFAGTQLKGSQHNDPFACENGRILTTSNHSGGVQGGISNGAPLLFRVAFKPVATIARTQHSVTSSGAPADIQASGRHDPCVLPRAVPLVTAMAQLVLADHALRAHTSQLSALQGALPPAG